MKKRMKSKVENSKAVQSKNWHALYVSSRAEKKVTETLLEKGIESYLPMIKTMRQWSDRKKMVELPLINGYVFIHVSAEQYDTAIQTRNVVGYVRNQGKAAVIRDEEIERLKQLVELGYQLETGSIKHDYTRGDKVKIRSGILKGIEGIIIRNDEGRCIDVLIESIGLNIRVKLPEEIVLPA